MPDIPPAIVPVSITSPVFGCFALACAVVYICSTGPMSRAKR